MITNLTKVIATSFNNLIAMDRLYRFTTDKKQNLHCYIPLGNNNFIKVRVEECSFMPESSFVSFTSNEGFEIWKKEKEDLARLCKGKILTKENL